MTRYFAIHAFLISALLASVATWAEAGGAPCASFKKLSNGTWTAVKGVKIEHGTSNGVINPGTIISPGTMVAGADVYAALQKNCH
jgi:hypothetical protein